MQNKTVNIVWGVWGGFSFLVNCEVTGFTCPRLKYHWTRRLTKHGEPQKKHRHPETSSGSCTSGHFSIPLLLYFSKAIPESERVLSASVRLPCSTPRAARAPRARQAHQRREDRSKHDRSKHGPRCALGWWRASARGRRRWCSGAAPGEATENSCFPSRKTNLPPVGKSSTFSLCKNATVNGKQLCGKDNK